MSRKLVIIGASAMGREACRYAHECGYEVKGFLDSRAEILIDYKDYPPILGTVADYKPTPEDVFVCAVGEPAAKQHFIEMLGAVQWATIIHPKAYIGQNIQIGEGSIVCPNASLTCDTTIGRHVIVNVNASVNHDCRVGDYVSISPGCHIAGWCSIGDGVFLGVGSSVVPHVTLGSGVFVAAGAMVTESTDAPRIMGVPARPK